jgi:hypothetical protein
MEHEPLRAHSLVSLRLDQGDDGWRLRELALLEGRRLSEGRYVVADVDGSILAAVPLSRGAALADPFVSTAHLIPLLELRAARIRDVELGLLRGRRLPRLRLRRV